MFPLTQERPGGVAKEHRTILGGRRGKTAGRRPGGGDDATPLLRAARAEALVPCEWGAALAAFCGGFRQAQATHGKRAVSWSVSPNLTNEELAFSAALARHGLGFTPGEAGVAPLLSLAWEAPEESDVVIVFGHELTARESPLWQRLACNRHQPRVITLAPGHAEPAQGETARHTPAPGSTLTLLYGLANIIIASGWHDHTFIQQRTTGCADYSALVAHYTTDRVCAETGLQAETVWELAQSIGTGARVSFCGMPETSPRSESALRNLALLTGQWGRAGTGLCLELEAANELGAHLFGQTGTLAECEAAVRRGELKALWLIATDATFTPHEAARWAELATGLDFFAVQGGSLTGLARQADLFLPTTGWAGKEGTRLDPSGRLRLLKARPQPAGCAMTDFHLFNLIAQYWGCGAFFSRWSSPESAFQLLKETTFGGVCDFSDVADYSTIDAYRPAPHAPSTEPTRLPFLFD